MKAIILAGGEGTRLRPLTCDLPKPMVPIANRPCMEHIINLLKRHGITRIGATLAYLPRMISDYFGTGEAFEVSMEYFIEEKPMGTAGCVGNAMEFLQKDTGEEDDFLVISGDALTDIDLTRAIQFHKEKKAMATLLLKQVEVPLEYGVVVTEPDGHIRRFVEKPSWGKVVSDQVNTGIYILSNRLLTYMEQNWAPDHRPNGQLDFAKDVFPRLLADQLPLFGCTVEGYWCDIGDLEAYAQANRDALDGTVQVTLPGGPLLSRENLQKIQVGSDCSIGENVTFLPPCLIGDHCVIEDGAMIAQHTILGNHCIIGSNASLKSSILWDGAQIGDGAELRGALICQNTKVEARTRIFEHAIVGSSCTVGADAWIRPRIKVWPGKQIAEGSRLSDHVVWDGFHSSGKSALFGDRGIIGTYGTSLTPSILCRMGSVFAASHRPGAALSVGHDGSPAAGAAALAFLGGAAAGGAHCWDAQRLSLPMLRFLVKEYGHHGAAFLHTEDDRLHIQLLDANGCDIPHKQEKKFERLYAACDLPPAPASAIYPVHVLSNGKELYLASLQRLLPTETSSEKPVAIALSGAPFLRETAEQILSVPSVKLIPFASKEEADFSVTFSEDGENFDLYDEKGNVISPDRVAMLISFLLLETYGACSLVLPVDQSTVHEWLSKQYGATLTRTGVSVQDMMERISALTIKEQADAQLSMRYDAIYCTVQIALFLRKKQIPLSALLHQIPHASMAQGDLDCAFHLKGRVMRKLAEENAAGIRETADGIQIFTEKGWILILPDAERPVVHITTEGCNEEYAKELLVDFETKINGYLQ